MAQGLEAERLEAEEPLLVLENVSEIDRELYFEGVKARGKGIKMWIFTILGVLLVPAGLLMYKPWVWLLGIVIVLLAQFSHVIVGVRDFSKLKRLYPSGAWRKQVRFYDDKLENLSGAGQVTTARYRDIRRTRESEHLYLIELRRNLPAILLRKDGFTLGSIDQLRPFLADMERADYEAARQNSLWHQLLELIRREKKR